VQHFQVIYIRISRNAAPMAMPAMAPVPRSIFMGEPVVLPEDEAGELAGEEEPEAEDEEHMLAEVHEERDLAPVEELELAVAGGLNILGVACVPAGPVALDATAAAVPNPPKGVIDEPPYWLT
jgi:hypothetical protein